MKKLLEIGLGIVTSVGGFLEIGSIATAAQAGAAFGFQLGWSIVLGTLCIAFLVEMSGRFSAVSKHTIPDAMRERFGANFFAVPLIVLGRPIVVALWMLPRRWRMPIARFAKRPVVRRLAGAIAAPIVAWLLHGLAIWLWHAPALFESAVHSDLVHAAQHVSFLGTGIIFWWAVLQPRRRSQRGVSILLLFTTAVHTGVLGALITFSRTPWYADYTRPGLFGLSPLSDQQLAGMIMWIPGSVGYLVAALFTVRRWLAESEWEVARSERSRYAVVTR